MSNPPHPPGDEFAAPSSTKKTLWRVPAEHADRRLDNLLMTRLGLPRGALYRLIRLGAIRLNGKKTSPKERLQSGDEILLPALRDEPRQDSPAAQPAPSAQAGKDLRRRKLASGAGFLVIDKPSGMAVQGGTDVRTPLLHLARAAFPQQPYLELVHRLDKDTSGCLALATSLAFVQQFQQQMRAGKVRKGYLCLVRGHWPKSHSRIEGHLGPETQAQTQAQAPAQAPAQGKTRPRGKTSPQGKTHRGALNRWAATAVKVLEYLPGCTLLRAEPLTGRTHQLRIQFAAAQAPIAGDRRYGDRAFNRRLAGLGMRRLFLHASDLSFADTDARRHRFEAATPEALNLALTALRG